MLTFSTTVSRGEIPIEDATDQQIAVINVFGAMGAMMTIGMTNVVTDADLEKFMSRVRFWERFTPLANDCQSTPEGDVFVPWPIPEDVVRSLMPIRTNVFPEVSKMTFVKNICSVYGEVK